MEDESAQALVPGLVFGTIGLAVLFSVMGDLFRGRLVSRERGRGEVEIGVSREEAPWTFYANVAVYTAISLSFLAGAATVFAPRGLGPAAAGVTAAMVGLGVTVIATLKRSG